MSELQEERDRAEWLADKLAETDRKLERAIAERDQARADTAKMREALGTAIEEIGADMHYVPIDAERRIRAPLASDCPGAPLLRLRDAALAWRSAVEAVDGIAATEGALLAALEEIEG